MFVTNGRLDYVLNTSSGGGGYSYTDDGVVAIANTPTGTFTIFRQVDGMVIDTLGQLWRPKFLEADTRSMATHMYPLFRLSRLCSCRLRGDRLDLV